MADLQRRRGSGVTAIMILVTCIASVLVSAEVLTRWVVLPASKIERRITKELAAADSIATTPRPTALVVGNSLLLLAVNFPDKVALQDSGWIAQRLVVEQTDYLDWRLAMERLWRRGAAPRAVVLVLDPGQLVADRFRGDYSALRLLDTPEILAVSQRLDLHPTEVSRLLLSHFSTFYGFRAELRKVILGKISPEVPKLMLHLAPKGASLLDSAALFNTTRVRLVEFAMAAREHEASLILIIPPLLNSEREIRIVEAAALAANVKFWGGSRSTSFERNDFLDGYHLGPEAAKLYSPVFFNAISELANGREPIIQ